MLGLVAFAAAQGGHRLHRVRVCASPHSERRPHGWRGCGGLRSPLRRPVWWPKPACTVGNWCTADPQVFGASSSPRARLMLRRLGSEHRYSAFLAGMVWGLGTLSGGSTGVLRGWSARPLGIQGRSRWTPRCGRDSNPGWPQARRRAALMVVGSPMRFPARG